MSNNYVQVPPNSTGVKMQTFENTVGGNTVDSEAVTLVRSSDNTEIGTSGQPVRVDPTGTTVQPISASALPLPTNAAQETGGNLAKLAGGVAAPGSAIPANALQVGGSDGTDIRAMLTDVLGQLKTLNGQQSASGAAVWTTATSVNTALTITTGLTSGVTFSYVASGTFSAGQLTLEVTVDGTNWTAVPVSLILSATTQASVFTASGNPWAISSFTNEISGFFVANNGYTGYRLRLSTAITGTGTPTITISWATNEVRVMNVIGAGTNGGTVVGAPVWTGGTDGNGTLRPLCTPSSFASDPTNGYPIMVTQYQTINGNQSSIAVRMPFIFKTAQVSSGTTASNPVWTPASGKKFRLQRFQIELSQTATVTAGALVTIQFSDGASAMPIAHDVWVPDTAATGAGVGYSSGWVDLANGILSATANNVLNMSLSSALTTGTFRINVCGNEE